MTKQEYEKILSENTKDGLISIRESNKIYSNLYPNAEFTLFRRENPRINIGYATIIIPSCYVEEYFESIPARKENIVYKNIGTFEQVRKEFRDFVDSNL